jgi:putative serine protease PepD
MTSSPKALALGAGLLVLVGGASGAVGAALSRDGTAPATPAASTAARSTTRSVTDTSGGKDTAGRVYATAKNSVAFISATSAQGQGTGSGFVVTADGKIITNEHVVDGAEQVTVSLGVDGRPRPATVLAADASKDLALLQVDTGGSPLTPLKLADSSKLQIGDTTYAIGNPFGLDHTFTSGIVSALDRDIQAPDGTPIRGAIQTDAAINPGNSGGALLDADGNVIGVNSQIAAGGGSGNVGIGFAIASNTVKAFLDNPTSSGDVPSQSQGQVDPYGRSQTDPYGQAPQDQPGLLVPQA